MEMRDPQIVRGFWDGYLSSLSRAHRDRLGALPEAWRFGGDRKLADELANRVITGAKTATCSRYRGGNLLDEGGLRILLDGGGIPQCVIETDEVTVCAFRDVDAEFAAAEGEGDLSLEYWRKAHWEFFTQEAEIEGDAVSEEMLVVCERFRVVYVNPALRGRG